MKKRKQTLSMLPAAGGSHLCRGGDAFSNFDKPKRQSAVGLGRACLKACVGRKPAGSRCSRRAEHRIRFFR